MSQRSLERKFGKEGRELTARAIAAVEALSSAEVAVFVREASASFLTRPGPKAVRKKAEQLFVKHGLDRSEGRNAVLLFVSLREREAVVLGDIAIDAKIDQAQWREVIAELTNAAKDGRLTEGICAAVARTGDILVAHFPRASHTRNELSNQPDVRP